MKKFASCVRLFSAITRRQARSPADMNTSQNITAHEDEHTSCVFCCCGPPPVLTSLLFRSFISLKQFGSFPTILHSAGCATAKVTTTPTVPALPPRANSLGAGKERKTPQARAFELRLEGAAFRCLRSRDGGKEEVLSSMFTCDAYDFDLQQRS